ncbi:acyl-CoA dehydrogenase family protein [Hyphococcus flavus]|uniref:Acyl-CoA dehydrogenase family protein n=1 Tax=Hyphococcus flavus TaxID=1866326 RepID=A0AAF0CFA5_9PROT|nr:acyl-CoA dehydrogenase family protein [Hyphococcus flavus]WDI30673.1 acyl-CoA dehydrogenase family protein [Hyphococcus flavus]
MSMDAESFELLLTTARRFVEERLRPLEGEVDRTDSMPTEIVDEMRELGLFGLTISEDYGGLGLNMEEECRFVFEMGRASPAFRSVFGTNLGIGSQAIVFGGTDEQKQHYLPKLAAGEIIGSFALTEPDVGSDAIAVQTKAIKDGDDYIINGVKRYITNAPRAHLFTLMARTAPERKADSISCFLVGADTPGIKLGKPDKKMGQHGTTTCDVIFDDCRVPSSALLGGVEGNGFRTAMKVLDKGRLHISALCVGVAGRLIEEMVSFSTNRKQFEQKVSEFQLIQAMIADSQTEMLAAKSLVLETARKRDAGENVVMDVAATKLFASEMVGRVADRAVQVHGGAGYISEYAVERLYRDVRLFRIYEGTSQIQQLIVAREIIKKLS